jgi:hypothetical protein
MNLNETEDAFWELIFSLDLKEIKVPSNRTEFLSLGNSKEDTLDKEIIEKYRNMQDDPLVKSVVEFYVKKS